MSTMTETPAAVGGTRYKEVKNALLAALAAHEWKGGEAIPAEKRLAERFGVSIGTLRKAIDELCAENILIRHQGLGTFVAMHQRDRHFFRFFRIVRNDGDKTYPTVSLVNFRKTKATQKVAARLNISEGAPVFQFTNQLALHGAVAVHQLREGVDALAVDQDIELDQVGLAKIDDLVVEGTVALGDGL